LKYVPFTDAFQFLLRRGGPGFRRSGRGGARGGGAGASLAPGAGPAALHLLVTRVRRVDVIRLPLLLAVLLQFFLIFFLILLENIFYFYLDTWYLLYVKTMLTKYMTNSVDDIDPNPDDDHVFKS
jgi:hypothetical protein